MTNIHDGDTCMGADEEIARLRRELEEERARLDWLVSRNASIHCEEETEVPAWEVWWNDGAAPRMEFADEPRQAIDAAREAEGRGDG